MDTWKKYGAASLVNVPVTLHKIPVFQREGSIVPRKMRIRRSSVAMKNDPFTLIVIPNQQGLATGKLYIDDEASFEYRHGKYLYLRLLYENKQLTSTLLQKHASYSTKSWLERVEIVNPPKGITRAVLRSKGKRTFTTNILEAKYWNQAIFTALH
jgi:alpha 1,3-glucosidase